MPVFMPKPPPTSPTTTWILSCAIAGSAAARPEATAVGIWLLMRTVIPPLAGSGETTTLRGSIATGETRWLISSSSMRTAARAKAASACAASPCRISAAMLSAASGVTAGAPAIVAARTSATAGSSSYSTATLSIASRAASRDSATTATTASPTWRTNSWASAWRGGLTVVRPSARLKPGVVGIGTMPAATRSAPV